MNSKRKTVIFVLVLFLSFLMISSSVLFALKKVEVVCADGIEINQDDVLNNGSFKIGTSIFFVSKQKVKKSLEKNYPKVKVVKIEKKFPSTISFEFKKRTPIFCASYEDNNRSCSFVFDDDCKVLSIKNDKEHYKLENESQQLTILDGFDAQEFCSLKEGDFLSSGLIYNCVSFLKSYGFKEQDFLNLKSICKQKENLILQTNFADATFIIFDVNKNLEGKIQLFASFCLNSNPYLKSEYQIKEGIFGTVLI